MVTKKRKAAKPRTRRVYRAAARKTYRRKKSGITDIPAAAATVALVAANYNGIKTAWNYAKSSSSAGLTKGLYNLAMTNGAGAKAARSALIGKQALIRDAVAVAGGYVAGEVAKKYAPGVIKRPMGKIAKKIPKVF